MEQKGPENLVMKFPSIVFQIVDIVLLSANFVFKKPIILDVYYNIMQYY